MEFPWSSRYGEPHSCADGVDNTQYDVVLPLHEREMKVEDSVDRTVGTRVRRDAGRRLDRMRRGCQRAPCQRLASRITREREEDRYSDQRAEVKSGGARRVKSDVTH